MGRVSSRAVSWWSRSPGCCGFRGVFWVRRGLFRVFFFCSNTHGRLQVRGRLASFSLLLVPECVQGAIIISLSVCVTFVVFTDCESCTMPISTNPGSMEAGEHGLTRGMFRLAPSRGGGDRRAAVDFVVCFGCCGTYFFFLFSFFFPSNPYGLLQV